MMNIVRDITTCAAAAHKSTQLLAIIAHTAAGDSVISVYKLSLPLSVCVSMCVCGDPHKC